MPGRERLVVCFVGVKDWARGVKNKPDAAVFEFLSDFHETVLPIAEDHDGRIVSVTGDVALIIFKPPEANKAVGAVRAMRERFDELQEAFDPAFSLELSAAMDVGEASVEQMGPPSMRRLQVTGRPVSTATQLRAEHDFAITTEVADEAEDADLSGIEIIENPQEAET